MLLRWLALIHELLHGSCEAAGIADESEDDTVRLTFLLSDMFGDNDMTWLVCDEDAETAQPPSGEAQEAQAVSADTAG